MRPNFDSLTFVALLGVFAIAYIPISVIAIMVLPVKGCG
jgi:high-affinity nickel permease